MSTLTDRYLAATLRSVPMARREEIASELRASIGDMIDGRTADGRDASTAEREVLTELGDPDRLAARYADRRLQLIGPRYYLLWRRLLGLLLSFIPAIVAVAVTATDLGAGKSTGGAIGSGISTAIQVAVHLAFWVTLVFAKIERINAPLGLPEWTPDQLPEILTRRNITLADTIASITLIALTIAWLPLQYVRSWVEDDNGNNIPIIDPALWSSWLLVIIGVLVASLIFEIVKYRVGRWNWGLVAANFVLDLAFVVPVVWLLLSDRLFNPELIQHFQWLSEGDNLSNLALGSAAGIAAIIVWDVIDSIIKTRHVEI